MPYPRFLQAASGPQQQELHRSRDNIKFGLMMLTNTVGGLVALYALTPKLGDFVSDSLVDAYKHKFHEESFLAEFSELFADLTIHTLTLMALSSKFFDKDGFQDSMFMILALNFFRLGNIFNALTTGCTPIPRNAELLDILVHSANIRLAAAHYNGSQVEELNDENVSEEEQTTKAAKP